MKRKKKRARIEPFVGITCDVNIPKGAGKAYFELVCDHRYPKAVKQAGGYPVLLPISQKKSVIRRYLGQVNGLIIVGGDDVDPALYREQKKTGTGTIFLPRMHFEVKLYRLARKKRIPILGICYGMQLMNVLEGGTLFQDIRRDAGSKLFHRKKGKCFHRIKIDRNSKLKEILGSERVMVNSDHHQAVCRVGKNFAPVAFSPDGIIEAIEDPESHLYAVQWHPERNLDHAASQKLFKAFVQLCRKHHTRVL